MNSSILSKILIIILIAISIIISITIKNIFYNNQSKALIMQIKKINLAIDEFTEKYHALPGDVNNTIKFGLSAYDTDGNQDNNIKDSNGNIILANSEIVYFWHHLSSSKILLEKYDGNEYGMAKTGYSFPESKIGNAGIIAFSDKNKTYLQIGFNYADSYRIYTKNETLTPNEAFLVDKKIDDQNPNKGSIFVAGGDNLNFLQNSICASNDTYNLNIKKPACQLIIELK
ncbi:MAG: hypothetical protein ACKO46_00245 [Alphaproteobacteria bacterium]